MTPQECFDRVVERLRDGTGRAAKVCADGLIDSVCMYLTPDGKKCAIGIFIPDGHEAQNFGGSVFHLVAYYPDIREIFAGINTYSLRVLQGIHDYHGGWTGDVFNERGEAELRRFARDYGLTYTPPSAV